MRVRPDKIVRKRRATVTKFDLDWNAKFSELQLFKDRFSNCNVPQLYSENQSLGRWVIRQRVYKEYLSPERISKLNSLGFIWNIPDYLWNSKYEELKAFKKKYGHCEVSKGSTAYLVLADWVGKQRRDYKLKYTRLTRDKIKKLDAIGFYWGENNTPWNERYKELEDFKIRFGHSKVPQRWIENPPLAAWVSIQRREYKKGKLNDQRVKQLDKLGFVWKIKTRKPVDKHI